MLPKLWHWIDRNLLPFIYIYIFLSQNQRRQALAATSRSYLAGEQILDHFPSGDENGAVQGVHI